MMDMHLNTLRPRQNGCIFHKTFSIAFSWMKMYEFQLKCDCILFLRVHLTILVQIMGWHQQGDKPLSEPIMINLLTYKCVTRPQWVNSLGPSDTIWRWRSWSTLYQIMTCCLTAPSHYLNQCWLIISKVLWHSSESIILRRSEDANQ